MPKKLARIPARKLVAPIVRKHAKVKLTRVRLDDDTLLLEVMRLGNFKTKRAAAEAALRELIENRSKASSKRATPKSSR